MSLINDLDISLKDFLPEHPGRIVADSTGPIAFVSVQLFARLREHAVLRGMSVSSVVHQVRDEIHHTQSQPELIDANSGH